MAKKAPDDPFWCEACRSRTLVESPPPAIIIRVICPICGQNVRYRREPTLEIPPPGTVVE